MAVPIPDPLAQTLSILFMAMTIVLSSRWVLRRSPPPYVAALVIAAVANGLGKWLVSLLHAPALIAYSVPTLAFLIGSWWYFRPSPLQLLRYWLFGFFLYLVIHVAISALFGWSFMFPFWRIPALG